MSTAPPSQPLGTTRAAGATADQNAPRTFPCEGCGADFEFNIGVQSLRCPYCGHVKQIAFDDDAAIAEQDFRAAIERVAEKRSDGAAASAGFREVACADCGATVRFSGTLTSQTCAYCGSPLQLADVHDAPDRIPVDGVLPFAVNRAQAGVNLRAWVASRWFAPSDFKARGVRGDFSGVYTPFWTSDTLTFTRYRGERGEHYWVTVGTGKNKRRERRTRWYPAHGQFQRFFDDVLVIAATGLPAQRLDALEPWPLQQCVPFRQELLAGFLARTYDVDLDDGFLQARTRIAQALDLDVRGRIGGDTQRVHSIDTRYDAITFKHLLLPVWMLAYRYGDKSYQVVVNAATGEVQGDRPYSWVKIALAVLAAVAVGGVIALIASLR